MNRATLHTLTLRTRLTFSLGFLASLSLLVGIILAANASTSSGDNRIDFGDGKTTIERNAVVKDGFVEFGSSPNSTPTTPVTQPIATQPPVTQNPGSPLTPTGSFQISGKTIVDPQGNVFVPVGANIAVRTAGMENGYIFNWRGTGTGRVQSVIDWGWNTVRATTICNTSNPSVDQVHQALNEFIAEYTARKVVVIVECHDLTGKNPAASNGDVQKVITFMERIASTHKNNPYVWFNPLNEPYASGDVNGWISLHNELYKRLRTIAPKNIFIADIPDFGNGIQHIVDGNLASDFGGGKCNVLYAWHMYGYINGFADDAKHKTYVDRLVAKNVAVIAGEFGDPLTLNEGTAGSPAQNRIGAYAAMKYMYPNGLGILWWHATGDSGNFLTYSLTQNRSEPWTAAKTGTGLSAAGKTFWDLTHPSKPSVRYTGSLANTACG